MFARSTRWLFLAVALTSLFVLIVERRRDRMEEARRAARLALRRDFSRAQTLTIESEQLRARLVRENDRWMLTEPIQAPADDHTIHRIFLALERLPRVETISAEERSQVEQNLSDYGLDPPRMRLSIEGGGPPLTLRIGRATPLGDAVYLMVEPGSEILLTRSGLPALLPTRIEQLRDRKLFRADLTQARRLDVRRDGRWVRLQRTESGPWVLTAPVPARADGLAVRRLLEQIAVARIGDFVAAGAAEEAVYGFDEPAAVVELDAPGWDASDALIVGREAPGGAGWFYARFRRGDLVFTIPSELVVTLMAPLEQWRDRRLTPLSAEQITAIRLSMADRALKLEREGGRWLITEPGREPAEDEYVEELIRSWVGAPILSFVDPPQSDAWAEGFEPPLGRIELFTRAGDSPMTILVGGRLSESGRLPVRVPPEPSVYETTAPLLQLLAPDLLSYRQRRLFEIAEDDVRSLTLERGGVTQMVRRDPRGPFTAENGARVADAELRARLSRILASRARFYAAENPEDLSPYGLDRPDGTLTIGLAGEAGIRKTIVVGRPTGSGNTFAMWVGKNLVFAIDEATRQDLLAELVQEEKPSGPNGQDPSLP